MIQIANYRWCTGSRTCVLIDGEEIEPSELYIGGIFILISDDYYSRCHALLSDHDITKKDFNKLLSCGELVTTDRGSKFYIYKATIQEALDSYYYNFTPDHTEFDKEECGSCYEFGETNYWDISWGILHKNTCKVLQ